MSMAYLHREPAKTLAGPGNGSPSATNVVLLVVVVSDFPFPKALAFLNRS